jgi:hypothetical protein
MENINELYNDICVRAREAGITTQEPWDDLVEEVIEEYRTNGLIDDDDPTEGMEDVLRGRFEEFHNQLLDEGRI